MFQVNTFQVNLIVELYRTDIETYAHQGLPRTYMAKSFHDRPDSTYLYLVRQCPYLHTLVSYKLYQRYFLGLRNYINLDNHIFYIEIADATFYCNFR